MSTPSSESDTDKDTPADIQLVIMRSFDAPRELVWQAWTEPKHLKNWLGGSGTGAGADKGKDKSKSKDKDKDRENDITIESAQMDLQVGGRFRIQQKMKKGEYYTAAGTYLEVKPQEKLIYTWDWEKDGSGTEFGELEGKETLITVEFREDGELTQMSLTHEKFASTKSRDGHDKGWSDWLDKMEKFIREKVKGAGKGK